MPLYVYENKELGVSIEIPSAVDDRRDEIVLKRRRVPDQIGMITGAKPMTTEAKLREGYKKIEEKGKLRRGPGYLSAAQVKRALETP